LLTLKSRLWWPILNRLEERSPSFAYWWECYDIWSSRCPDCKRVYAEPGVFMVHDDIWASLGLDPDAGWFCMDCIEHRLGRVLAALDLCPVPANDGVLRGRAAT
jgi:hypothetical protein